jgi:hypothetical protein
MYFNFYVLSLQLCNAIVVKKIYAKLVDCSNHVLIILKVVVCYL